MLLTRAALGNAINAATGCKDEIADPRLGGKLAQPDGGIQIDSFGHFFETIAHRVVGNGRQVDHRVSVSQQAWIERSNIAEMLMIQILLWRGIFRRQAVAEEAGVEPVNRRARVDRKGPRLDSSH